MIRYHLELSGAASLAVLIFYGACIAVAFWCLGRLIFLGFREWVKAGREGRPRTFWGLKDNPFAYAAGRNIYLASIFIGIWWVGVLGTIMLAILAGEPAE